MNKKIVIFLFMITISLSCTNLSGGKGESTNVPQSITEPMQATEDSNSSLGSNKGNVQEDDGSRFPIKSPDGLWGYINRYGTVVIKPQFSWANRFHEGLGLVCNNNLCGYIDPAGDILIPLIFDKANSFSEGLASVTIDRPENLLEGMQAGVASFIDKTGKVIINSYPGWGFTFETELSRAEGIYLPYFEDHYPESTLGYFHDGYALVEYGYYKGFVYGNNFIDRNGIILFPENTQENPFSAYNFSEGLAAIVPFSANFISEPKPINGFAFIDTSGKSVIKYDNIYNKANSFSDGLALVDGMGFIDKTGKIIIPWDYSHAQSFSEGLAGVCKKGECKYDEHQWGFIDKSGTLVIDYQYDQVSQFSDGLAEVRIYDPNSFNTTYYFINSSGKTMFQEKDVIPEKFLQGDIPNLEITPFIDGLAHMQLFIKKGDQTCGISGYINTKGNLIYSEIYSCP